uniref:Uncharacterized protein n=1 Tax=Chenopodium quinoa TaxID=63459 RepID=A0A803MY20_CHEQI
ALRIVRHGPATTLAIAYALPVTPSLYPLVWLVLLVGVLPKSLKSSLILRLNPPKAFLTFCYPFYNCRDFFNMFGCLLEPATDMMPHQVEVEGEYNVHRNGGVEKQNGNYGHTPISSANQSGATMSSPIPLPGIPRSHSAGQDSFYTSARSLSTSHTPTRRSFAAPWRPSTTVDVEDPIEEPLLGGSLPTRPMHPSKPKNLLCIVPALIFIAGTLNFTRRDTRLSLAAELPNRKLLQVNGQQKITSGVGEGIGTYMGWAMAVIYMGGRLPQICLNVRFTH